MNKNKLYSIANLRNAFFSEIGIGISANAILLLFHVSVFFLEHRPNPTDLPTGLLALTHLMMLVIAGFLATDIFVSWHNF